MSISERLQLAWAALTRPAAETNLAPGDDVERELARLRLDLRARDEEIARLRAEYARRDDRAGAETAAAGREAVGAMIEAAAPVLSQLATLRQMGAGGREVRAADALKLAGKLEEALRGAGLDPIGEPGAETEFDPTLHQRMSGGDVKDGDRVRVRFIGYRYGGEVRLKALVSRAGQPAATASAD